MTGDDKNHSTTKTENDEQEVILLEDLPPKRNVRGGSAKTVFGESQPRGSDAPSKTSASGHNPGSTFDKSKRKRG